MDIRWKVKMPSKKGGGITVTISKPSASIALRYGSNVSKGIKKMGELLVFMRAEDKRKVERALENSRLESLGNLEH